MDPTLGEKQNDQTQKKQSGGGINQGINAINNLLGGGVKNPLGKIGPRVATQTALRGFTAFLAGPGLPVTIALISILVFTIIIVGFGGAPSSGTNTQSPNPTTTPTTATSSAALSPELNITPTPGP